MILSEGRNCWRIAHAARAAFLIDGDAYFTAFRAAALRARESIVIVGWDLDSRERLGRGGGGPTSGPSDDDDLPAALVPFLNELLTRRPGLQVHVLVWDFSMIFAFEREPLPTYQFALRAHPRLHFHMDGVHPVGASHHQKVVVVDDAVAFAGGIDLTKCRWDTPEHRAVDPRRVDPGGKPYGPIHDVQMVVDGEAAAALGELVRWRWNQATGQPLAVPARRSKRAFADARDDDGWPPGLRPDVQDVPIAIARTLPAYEDRPAASEVHQLVLDAIAAARRFLYVENQYLTSASVGEALAGRLRDEQGPEVVLVLPRFECGWLEQSSMGVLRARMLAHLRNADRHCRLHVYYPTVPGLPSDGCVNVHAKILVVDDRLLRIGSSNLSNRSMGFDTECDLAIEAQTEGGETARAIAGLRNRLLGEHLGVSPDEVAVATAAQGSLVAAIESLRGRPAHPGTSRHPAGRLVGSRRGLGGQPRRAGRSGVRPGAAGGSREDHRAVRSGDGGGPDNPILWRDMALGKEITMNFDGLGPVARYITTLTFPNAASYTNAQIEIPSIYLNGFLNRFWTFDAVTNQLTERSVPPGGVLAYSMPGGPGTVTTWSGKGGVIISSQANDFAMGIYGVHPDFGGVGQGGSTTYFTFFNFTQGPPAGPLTDDPNDPRCTKINAAYHPGYRQNPTFLLPSGNSQYTSYVISGTRDAVVNTMIALRDRGWK